VSSGAPPPPDPARAAALTLDCYGTLIDWEAGAVGALRPLLARHGAAPSDDEVVAAFQDLDEELCAPPFRPYRAVLAGVVEGLGRRFGFPVGPSERDLLAASLPSWEPFPDTVAALRALKRRHRLAVVSNVDDDLFAATARRLGVAFDHVVTSEQVRSYKPRPAIFEEAIRRLGVAPGAVAHVAEGASEIPTARRLGCATVWVRRRGRSARHVAEAPDLEVPDLASLAARPGPGG
jgi:2-haloacid dehalogenase